MKRELRRNRPNAPRGFVLVWNVTGFSGSDIGPLAYARTLAINPKKGDIFKIWQIKAVPLSPKASLDGAPEDWSVESWLWLILAEVTE